MLGLNSHALASSFQESVVEMGLVHVGFTLHSLRYGGTSEAMISGGKFEEIKAHGLWASDASYRRYLNSGKAILLSTTLSARTQERGAVLFAI